MGGLIPATKGGLIFSIPFQFTEGRASLADCLSFFLTPICPALSADGYCTHHVTKIPKHGSCTFKCHHSETAALPDAFRSSHCKMAPSVLDTLIVTNTSEPPCTDLLLPAKPYERGGYLHTAALSLIHLAHGWDWQPEPYLSFNFHISCCCWSLPGRPGWAFPPSEPPKLDSAGQHPQQH